jgi:hypothetical protein
LRGFSLQSVRFFFFRALGGYSFMYGEGVMAKTFVLFFFLYG